MSSVLGYQEDSVTLALFVTLQETLSKDVTILGGGADFEDLAGGASFQFYNDRVIEDGVLVLLLCGPLTYSIGVDTGWKPVGKKGTVTRAEDIAVIEIDGAPHSSSTSVTSGRAPSLRSRTHWRSSR
ncbi:MAG: hypothetical protein LC808_35825 [Actinobacteria bacterium]|nr:hypothetical protein [Actinomycetota bacterium]